MAQLSSVHRHDDLRLGGVGKHETRVLLYALARAAFAQPDLDQPVVGRTRLLHGLQKDLLGLCIGADARRNHEAGAVTEVHVALRLLVVAGQPMPHELMCAGAAHTIDGEGERGVFESRMVAGAHEGAHQLGDSLVVHLLLEIGGRDRRVAEPAGDRDGAFGLWRMMQERDAEKRAHADTVSPSCSRTSCRSGG